MAKKSRKRATQNQPASAAENAQSSPQQRAESRRAQRVLQERHAKRRRIYTMFGGAAAAALVLALILVLINQEEDAGAYADEPITMPPPISADVPRDGRTLGDPDAPVQIVEYGDYQCPGCANFATSVKPQLINDYVASGQVFFEYRELRGLGSESNDASVAAACALEQDMYWEFHDMLYYNQAGRDDGGFSDQRMTRMAEQLEMDVDAFEDCLGTDRFDDELDAMTDMASDDSIRATPSVIINGTMLEGPSYDQVRQAVEAALQEAGS
jgi:protein-disulfide isomerase